MNLESKSLKPKYIAEGKCYYVRDYSQFDPIEIYNKYNLSTQKKLNTLLDQIENAEAVVTNEDEKTILNLLVDFYLEKSKYYKVCTCKSCKLLTLPFMIKRTINDNDEKIIKELETKHNKYYNCLKISLDQSNNGSSGTNISASNNETQLANEDIFQENEILQNIFVKKVNLTSIKITASLHV